ncbi:glycerophosphodiester phosphodiesterase [Paenibacillus piri]|uniref:Glycerophosphodiester phosphodiesterase n=1 Tax=Paenibacillus piri TaxID=2547395 RepID=A0A4R5KKZ4_9BACL|nr:glycerophosphodiester phosphodiesterase family protein [Paenibacillus piri]TDF96241.1 glycerophosphodiester phosphodiesterase [Paenibacillus piri]
MKNQTTLVIGHRGAAGEAPENTLVSFRLAIRQGADALELDIHESAEGELVVCHDETVNRTTNGSGRIADLSAEELKRLDAGSWFGPQFGSEQLPLLQEVFALVPPAVMINVEIKCPYSARLEQRLLELLRHYGRLDSVVVSSFDHKTLIKLKRKEPALRIGLLYSANVASHRQLAAITGEDVYSLHPQYKLIDADDVADAVRSGLQVYPFTINKENDLRQALAAGVSGIITDFPGRLRELMNADKARLG